MPTTAHFIYIPAVLSLGVVIGFVLGGRAARDAQVAQAARDAARAERRAARAAKGAAAAPESGDEKS
jgi:hypothetical protein